LAYNNVLLKAIIRGYCWFVNNILKIISFLSYFIVVPYYGFKPLITLKKLPYIWLNSEILGWRC